MTDPSSPLFLVCLSLRLLSGLLSVLLKASLLVAFTFVLQWLMRNASSRLRQVLWLCCIGGSLVVLALGLCGPLFPLTTASVDAASPLAPLSSALAPAPGGVAEQSNLSPLAAETWRLATEGEPWPERWPPLALAVLVVGVLWGWLRMLVGRVRLAAGARRGRDAKELRQLTDELCRRLGIRRAVRVVEQDGVTTPLVRGVLHPVIALPSSMRTWPVPRMRGVLLHELSHVRHADSLCLGIAYAIRSLLWFVPPIWLAYSRLYREQEKACDASVIHEGMRRHSYASCILEAAQLCREPALLPGLGFSGTRKRILKDRIHAIVQGERKMKRNVLVFGLSLVLLAGAVVLNAAGSEGKGKVLMLVRDGYPDAADYMIAQEAAIMKLTLESAGYRVLVATAGGQPVMGSSVSLKADLKMSDVQLADFQGVIMPCMAAGQSPIPPDAVTLLRKASAMKKPMALQNSAVLVLYRAGGTKGRRVALDADLGPLVKDATYAGIGVVQDANLVTSGTCPFMAMQLGKPDGTRELTQKFVTILK